MKKIIIISMLLILSAASFSQPATTTDYLQKSKKQKTAAWIMMSGGLACSLAGSILSAQLDFMGDTAPLFDDKTTKTGIVLNIIGLCSIAGSIPLFIVSHKNKKRAMNLSFKNETAPQLQNSKFVNQPVPSLSLKISL